jgi:uncharacterized protein YkwD
MSTEERRFGDALDAESRRRLVSRFLRGEPPESQPAANARGAAAGSSKAPLPGREAPSRPAPRAGVPAEDALQSSPATVSARVPGSGDWWHEQLRSRELTGETTVRPPPPPPPPPMQVRPAVASATPGGAEYGVPVRRGLVERARRNYDHVTAVTAAVILVVAAALIVAPARTTSTDAPPTIEQPPAVDPQPSRAAPAPALGETPGLDEPSPQPSPARPSPSVSPPAAHAGITYAQQLLQRINEIRQSRGRRSLLSDSDLERVAVEHVGEMIERGRLFHTPNAVLAERVTNWRLLAESIGVGPDVSALIDAFLRSSMDRRNLLDSKFWHAGVAAVRDGRRLWVTLVFNDRSDPETTLPSTEG